MSTIQIEEELVQVKPAHQVDVELVERILQSAMQFYTPHFQTLQAQNAAAEAKQEILMQRIHDLQLTMAKVDVAAINTSVANLSNRLTALENDKTARDGMVNGLKTLPQVMGYFIIAVGLAIAFWLGKEGK